MSYPKTFQCVVDDTALISNIDEIENWVLQGVVTLVIPLYTLERLHLLKKDAASVGQNARKAVKFLDEVSSNNTLKDPVTIQGPEEQYATWPEVEAHYKEGQAQAQAQAGDMVILDSEGAPSHIAGLGKKRPSVGASGVDKLSQVVAVKLNLNTAAVNASPASTPPLSPSSSGNPSAKASPEVQNAVMLASDVSPVPPTLKALINSVVWYVHARHPAKTDQEVVFLTNSPDTSYLARDFGIPHKNIHQLRNAVGLEDQAVKNRAKIPRKASKVIEKTSPETRTLFRYEDDASSDEEVIFKPRGRGSSKGATPSRGIAGSTRSRAAAAHSPANSLSNVMSAVVRPQIPTEEIDPDSFDRGSFGRGSTPLASVGNQSQTSFPHPRGSANRGSHINGGSARGNPHRGSPRGAGFTDRGASRGRGRLFVP